MFSLLTALLLVLAACSTSPEAVKEQPDTAKAMEDCDEFLNENASFDFNYFRYETDYRGRPSMARSLLPLGSDEITRPADRDESCQRKVGNLFGDVSVPERQGGHLIGAQLGGWKRRANLVAQNSQLNLGDWKRVENQAAKCDLRDDQVYMKAYPQYFRGRDTIPSIMTMEFTSVGSDGSVVTETANFSNQDGEGTSSTEAANRLIFFLIASGCN